MAPQDNQKGVERNPELRKKRGRKAVAQFIVSVGSYHGEMNTNSVMKVQKLLCGLRDGKGKPGVWKGGKVLKEGGGRTACVLTVESGKSGKQGKGGSREGSKIYLCNERPNPRCFRPSPRGSKGHNKRGGRGLLGSENFEEIIKEIKGTGNEERDDKNRAITKDREEPRLKGSETNSWGSNRGKNVLARVKWRKSFCPFSSNSKREEPVVIGKGGVF